MSGLAWMKTYIGTETAITGHLTAEEFGAYERLRRHLWQHGVIPEDEERLSRITGMDVDRWRKIANAITPLLADAIANLLQERISAANKRQKKIDAGKKGAESRWQNHGKTIDHADTDSKANGSRMANDIAQPMRNQWPSASASDEVRYEEELALSRTHARDLEPSEYPLDPPETAEEGRAFLERRKVPEEQIEHLLSRLMNFQLYERDLTGGTK